MTRCSAHHRHPALSLTFALGSAVCLLLTSPSRADIFNFSTGTPDGKIATLSRPASGGTIQTETADDFVLPTNTLLKEAIFTGLIPSTPLENFVQQVEIEFYHVFPLDSVNPPSGNVPTRTNSPADVEIASATRDSLGGTLSYTVTVLNNSFSASNSVVNGINKFPNQFTWGEGPVTGREVMLQVTFNPPVALPGGHYFFRPEVLLSSGNFLWLSAPKPIVPPGTPFAEDLQSWIRNDNLAPDWLRIGTDITHEGPFNASFALAGETDSDADSVPDSEDQCPGTPPNSIVDSAGCSIAQLVPCDGPATGGTWKNHGQYVSSIALAATEFLQQGLITEAQREAIVSEAARSDCGQVKKK